MDGQSPNYLFPRFPIDFENFDSGLSISVNKINHRGFRKVLENAQFIGCWVGGCQKSQ